MLIVEVMTTITFLKCQLDQYGTEDRDSYESIEIAGPSQPTPALPTWRRCQRTRSRFGTAKASAGQSGRGSRRFGWLPLYPLRGWGTSLARIAALERQSKLYTLTSSPARLPPGSVPFRPSSEIIDRLSAIACGPPKRYLHGLV
jgi:hypothetical protein